MNMNMKAYMIWTGTWTGTWTWIQTRARTTYMGMDYVHAHTPVHVYVRVHDRVHAHVCDRDVSAPVHMFIFTFRSKFVMHISKDHFHEVDMETD
jgi:hypothetical protein